MKQTRKLLSILLALAMVCALATTAFATDTGSAATYTITAPDNGHTYEVYQIFTGDLDENVLSNVKWGKNGTGTEGTAVSDSVLSELQNASGSDTEKLAVITKYVSLSSDEYGTVTNAAPLTSVPAGYYLIKDVDGQFAGQDDAYTLYIVQIVDNVTIAPKSAKPTVDKQVHDETTDAEDGATDGWGESADHAINESFQFKLIANLPEDTDFAAYSTYKVVFTDTMSTGVTFESIASVTVDGVTLSAAQYTASATAGQAGGSWTLTIEDIKAIEGVNLTDGADIVVIYNAHLNANAYVNTQDGNTTNLNKVYLEYSNNPNASGSGELGKTPEDTVWVFTYTMQNTKYADQAATGKELEGAGFKLYTDADCTNEYPLIKDESSDFYRPTASGETGVEMMSGENGKFNIKGLDTGTYYLKETTTPAGYNTCDVIKVVISATHAENEARTDATTDITMTVNDVAATENNVVNNSGTTLPETGGIGTTIFYTVGGILVLVAVVLLVTKKRMNGAEV